MTEVDDYILTLTPPERAELERLREIVMETIPEAEQGVNYGMPAFFYRGWPVVSVMVLKNHLSLYPFSGKVTELLADALSDFEVTPGSIHFTLELPLPEDLCKQILAARLAEIAEKKPRAVPR
jgi:uncharacterized protein YdhG (YjbR/CyaY superfamily)